MHARLTGIVGGLIFDLKVWCRRISNVRLFILVLHGHINSLLTCNPLNMYNGITAKEMSIINAWDTKSTTYDLPWISLSSILWSNFTHVLWYEKRIFNKEKEINSFAVFCLMWIMCFWVKTAVTWLPPFSHAGLIPHWATPLTLLFAAVTHTYFWCYKSSPADYNWLVKITPLTSPPVSHSKMHWGVKWCP